MKKNILTFIFSCCILGMAISGCEKNAGDYDKYLDQAEKVFPGKPKSLTVFQGYNRAQISALMSPDPRVVRMRLYWNNRRDSIDTDITPADLAKSKLVDLAAVPEGVYTFEAVTFDASGRRSVVLAKTGSILGDNYLSTLFNRVLKAKITVGTEKAVSWYSETDTASAMAGVRVSYPLKTGGTGVIFTRRLRDTTILTNALTGGNMTIKTAYLPKNAIDTFYSKPEVLAY
ncbi:DUF4998 domain-containing protein [Pedobacter metabolipauper]|uniref:Uncharacterized protein DUF4998 n=1 Tax=Pedobacter metabolipauper TaxID=425513 RepID=A0A4R6SUI3_9SPHI|nr:DUF4998 domain-containing protein [Pedobacter metabolipauper]TDQ08079.1 uncharacterized protein DUF4998 [Pedobacter metabolipauper]